MPEYSLDGITPLALGARSRAAAGGGRGGGWPSQDRSEDSGQGQEQGKGPSAGARVIRVGAAAAAGTVAGDLDSPQLGGGPGAARGGVDESFFSTDGKTVGMWGIVPFCVLCIYV